MLPDGVMAALPELVGRPLAAFAAEYLAEGVPFGGRARELAALDAWLGDPGRPFALVVAGAGRGKSALLARWARGAAARVPVVFAPVSIRFGTALRTPAMVMLAAQLRRIAGSRGEVPRDPDAARAEIEAILAAPGGEGPRLLVLDGLDEAVGWSVPRDLPFPAEPAPGLKILVSARELAGCDLDGWRRRLGFRAERTLAIALPPLGEDHVAEVLRGMGDALPPLGDRAAIARLLVRVSEGDPLVLRLYVDALRAEGGATALLVAGDLAHALPGLGGYLERWWAEQRAAWQGAAPRLERDARELLGALATALGPLGREDLDALVPARDPDERDATLRALGRLVIGDGRDQGYVFAHPRLAYHHAERMSADERAAWERRFVEYGEAARADLAGGGHASAYVVRHHGAHLERSGAGLRELSRLVEPSWQRAWEALEGGLEGFLGDVERAAGSAEAALAAEPDGADAEAAAGGAAAALYRCALVRASIASLAHNVPPPLFAGLVEAEVWSPAVALSYAATHGEPAIAAIAHLLPERLVEVALGILDGPGLHDRRPAALVGLLRRRLDQGRAHEVLPYLARQIPEDRASALLELAPHLPEKLRPAACAEIHEYAEGPGEHPINGRTTLLMQLAALLPHRQRPEVLERAIELQDWDCGLAARHLMLLGRAGDLEQALSLAERETDPYTRSLYLANALAGARGVEQATRAFHAWERAERAVWEDDDTVLRSVWPLPLPPPLVAAFLALARELPFARVRAQTLTQLALVHRAGVREALEAVRALDGPDHLFGLLALAPALDGPERAAALAPVIAAVRARRWGVPDKEWDSADCRWRLPDDGEIEWTEHSPRTAAELLATAARLLPDAERAPLLREALARSRVIGDDEERSLALAALADRLGGDAQAEVRAAALAAARAEAVPQRRARALAALAPVSTAAAREALAAAGLGHGSPTEAVARIAVAAAAGLPAAEQRAALEALLDVCAGGGSDDPHGTVLRVLVPHLPVDLLERALREVTGDRAVLTVAVGGEWPPDRQPAAEAAARGVLAACMRCRFEPPKLWLADLAPRFSTPLLREAIDIAIAAQPGGRPREHEWVLAVLLPCLARHGAAAEAVEHARAIASERPRIRILCSLLPHLAPPLLDPVAAEVLERVRALPPGPCSDEFEQHWTARFLEAACTLAPLGHAVAVAAAVARAFGPSSGITILLELAGGVDDAAVRREVLADATDRVLGLPDDHFSGILPHYLPGFLPSFLAHAADLERRPLAAMVARALKAVARHGRVGLLGEDDEARSLYLARALELLGGEAAVLGAARACVEVGRWFP